MKRGAGEAKNGWMGIVHRERNVVHGYTDGWMVDKRTAGRQIDRRTEMAMFGTQTGGGADRGGARRRGPRTGGKEVGGRREKGA